MLHGWQRGMAGYLSGSFQLLWYFCLWGGGVGKSFSLDLLELVWKLEVGRQLTGTALSSKGFVLFGFFLN